MLVIAVIGLVVNLGFAFVLGGHADEREHEEAEDLNVWSICSGHVVLSFNASRAKPN